MKKEVESCPSWQCHIEKSWDHIILYFCEQILTILSGTWEGELPEISKGEANCTGVSTYHLLHNRAGLFGVPADCLFWKRKYIKLLFREN